MKTIFYQFKKGTLFILGSTFFLQSCDFDDSYFNKEVNDLETSIGLNIGYIEYSAEDLFQDLGEDLETDSYDDNGTSLVSFTYSETIEQETNTEDIVVIEAQSTSGNFDLLKNSGLPSANLPYNGADLTYSASFTETKELKANNTDQLDVDLTLVQFSSGKLNLSVFTDTKAQVEGVFSIPSLIHKTNNTSYEQDFIINNKTGSDTNTASIDLSEYELNLTIPNTDNSDDIVNNLSIGLDATATINNGDTVSSNNKITYKIEISSDTPNTNPNILFAKGDFKQKEVSVSNHVFDLDLFEELGDGNIEFVNPILSFTANNGFGFPVGIALGGISTNANQNNKLQITNTDKTDNLEVNIDTPENGVYAVLNGAIDADNNNQLDEVVKTTITLDNSNSNLADLLNESPSKFNLNVTATPNPNTSNSTISNENIYEADSNFSVDVNVELPMYVAFEDLSLSTDPIELDLDEDDLDENFDISLIIYSRNTIPMDATINLDFLDSNENIVNYTNSNNEITSFTKNIDNLITSAPVNSEDLSLYTIENGILKNGESTIEPSKTTIELTKEEIEALNNVEQISFNIVFNTSDSDNDGTPNAVKIKTTDTIRLDISTVINDITITL